MSYIWNLIRAKCGLLRSIHDEFDGWDRQMMGYLSNSRDSISHSVQLQVIIVYPS